MKKKKGLSPVQREILERREEMLRVSTASMLNRAF